MNKDYSVLDELTSKTQELHRAIFDKGYTAGYKQGIIDNNGNAKRQANDSHEQSYQEGLEDAWQYMKKIAFKETEGGIPLVGDEVIERHWGGKGIVTRANEVYCYVMWEDGSSGNRDKDDLNKTGKHIDGVDEILKQLKG